MSDTKFFTIFISALIGVLALVIFLAGLPDYDYYHFADSNVVCKKWNTTWRLGYDHDKCWDMIEKNGDN